MAIGFRNISFEKVKHVYLADQFSMKIKLETTNPSVLAIRPPTPSPVRDAIARKSSHDVKIVADSARSHNVCVETPTFTDIDLPALSAFTISDFRNQQQLRSKRKSKPSKRSLKRYHSPPPPLPSILDDKGQSRWDAMPSLPQKATIKGGTTLSAKQSLPMKIPIRRSDSRFVSPNSRIAPSKPSFSITKIYAPKESKLPNDDGLKLSTTVPRPRNANLNNDSLLRMPVRSSESSFKTPFRPMGCPEKCFDKVEIMNQALDIADMSTDRNRRV